MQAPANFLEKLTELGIQYTDEQVKQVETYVSLLIKWNKAYNLIGKSTENEIYFRHILDSAQLVPHVSCETKVLDIGAGAGLPSIVLAILSGAHVTACEPLSKRCTFMNEVRRKCELHDQLTVLNSKAEEIDRDSDSFNVITSRAVADVTILVDISSGLLAQGGQYVLLKGENYRKEISDPCFSLMTISTQSSITSPGGKILKIKP